MDSNNLHGKEAGEKLSFCSTLENFQSILTAFSRWEGSLASCLSVLYTHGCISSIFIPFNHLVHLGDYLKDVRLKSALYHLPISLISPFFSGTFRDGWELHANIPRIDIYFPHLSLFMCDFAYLFETFQLYGFCKHDFIRILLYALNLKVKK